ncbi:AAA family ATPase [Peristeroidobacter soli]|uniref:AAA family ATPase n=1 Tax=Peristeroidobacter soli TaxID=2497877 RepID=UPI001300A330|nr:ATP-binding protein [Peristeroidobacter soli]
MDETICLSPSQAEALAQIERCIGKTTVVTLNGKPDCGRTTLAQALAARGNRKLLDSVAIALAIRADEPARADESIGVIIREAVLRYDVVILDDASAYLAMSTPRMRGHLFWEVVLPEIIELAEQRGVTLVIIGEPQETWLSKAVTYGGRAIAVALPELTEADYRHIASTVLGPHGCAQLDFESIQRRMAGLTATQIVVACRDLLRQKQVSTQGFVAAVERWFDRQAIDLSEVEQISFDELPGLQTLAASLERNVILPLERTDLALRFGLTAKRGVLLYGPPGTGKTSIGRALAKRLQGRFFMVDGSVISEPPSAFFGRLDAIVRSAIAASPAVLFIDDADLLFELEHIAGLQRYLLTILDGLESDSASRVCVILAVMDVRKVPDAIIRSGRVELWLETKAPEEGYAADIMQVHADKAGFRATRTELEIVAAKAAGFTPADLRRVVNEAKLLQVTDQVDGAPARMNFDYLNDAAAAVLEARAQMQLAVASL